MNTRHFNLVTALFIALMCSLVSLSISPLSHAATTPANVNSACPLNTQQHYIDIGGIKQWLSIHGKHCNKPVILMLHGGPGSPLSLYHNSLFKQWEDDFIIVHWDQRGAGKTFEANHPQALSMEQLLQEPFAIEQFIDDGLAVTDVIRDTLGVDKVILAGTSWGTFLGLRMAHRAPEKYAFFVGSSALINYQANTLASYQRMLSVTKQNAADHETLTALGTPPWKHPKAFGRLRKLIAHYERKLNDTHEIDANYTNTNSRNAYTAGEDFSFLKFVGLRGTGAAQHIQLDVCCVDYKLPIYLLQGEQDNLSTATVTHAFYETLTAPKKRYIPVANAGHELNKAMLAKTIETINAAVSAF